MARCRVFGGSGSVRLLSVLPSMLWMVLALACGDAGAQADARSQAAALVESLAAEAVAALRIAAWHEGGLLSPVLACEVPGAREVLVEALRIPPRPRGASTWQALRAGRSAPTGACVAGTVDASDVDLDRACALLVREALIDGLDRLLEDRLHGERHAPGAAPDFAERARGPGRAPSREPRTSWQLPAEAIGEILRATPAPPTNPAADPGLVRHLGRLARMGRMGEGPAADARVLADELPGIVARAEEWRVRFDRLLDAIARMADGAEGVALVEVVRTERCVQSGWPFAEVRGSGTVRPNDRVHARVQLAMLESPPCEALGEALLGLRASRVDPVESLFVTAEGRLMLGRSRVELSQVMIDRWRSACGLKRTSRGWEGLPARPRAPARARTAQAQRAVRDQSARAGAVRLPFAP